MCDQIGIECRVDRQDLFSECLVPHAAVTVIRIALTSYISNVTVPMFGKMLDCLPDAASIINDHSRATIAVSCIDDWKTIRDQILGVLFSSFKIIWGGNDQPICIPGTNWDEIHIRGVQRPGWFPRIET